MKWNGLWIPGGGAAMMAIASLACAGDVPHDSGTMHSDGVADVGVKVVAGSANQCKKQSLMTAPQPTVSLDHAEMEWKHLRAFDRFTHIWNSGMEWDRIAAGARPYYDRSVGQFHTMRDLFVSPRADALFKRLYQEDNTYSKLYALSGVYFTDRQFYDRALESLRHEAGLDRPPDPCRELWTRPSWASLLDGFVSKDGDPPVYPTYFRDASNLALDDIQAYLSRGGDPNGLWFESPSSPPTTILTFAAASGELQALQLVLDRGGDASPEKNAGMSLLAMYAACGATTEVERLLDKGVQIDAQQDNGFSALHWAAKNDHLQTVRLLLERGANPNIRSNQGFTPLYLAVYAGGDNPSISERLIFAGADYRNWPDSKDDGIWKASHGHLELFHRLLTELPSTPDLDNQLSDLLYFSIKHREPGNAQLLLQHGATLKPGTYTYFNVEMGAYGWDTDAEFVMLNILVDHGLLLEAYSPFYPGLDPLEYAAINGRTSLVEYFVARGDIISQETWGGVRTLLRVVIDGHREIVELLLKAGRGVTTLALSDRADLYFAAQAAGHPDIAGLFLSPNNTSGLRPSTRLLLQAVDLNNVPLVENLLSLGADVNAQLEQDIYNESTPGEQISCGFCRTNLVSGMTALHVATENHYLAMMKALLDQGANPNLATQSERDTPLHLLFLPKLSTLSLYSQQMRDAATLLVSRGARPDIQNQRGKTPLFLAVQEFNLGAVQLLLDLGSNANVGDESGVTPLQMAQDCDEFCQQEPVTTRLQACTAELLQAYGAKP